MKLFYTLLLAFLVACNLKAQDFDNYQTLLSKGDMPEDFRLLASQKYKKELEVLETKTASRKDKKRMQDFALESNFAVTELMMSGRVIYGDDLGDYVNKIADILLKDDPSLRKELRFYILKSTVANAFSTNQGIIFITSGLIAQVENEAQLAFIIAHEIIHYTEKHNYESFKKREAILKKTGRKSTVSIEEKLKSLYKYSKGNETEADEKGMALFLKSDYNPYAALTGFDVLLYSYLPYDMIEWKPSVFETEYYKFPETYYSSKLKDISADENEDDEKLTHPNVAKRKSNIQNLLDEKSIDSSGKHYYLVSESEFKRIQKISRFELASLYVKSGNVAKAYYIAYLLDNTYGANTYTDKIKSMCLYSLAHHSAFDDDLDDYGCEKDEYEGEVQMIPIFFSKLRKKDWSVLAAKYLYEMTVKYPKDNQLKRMCDQIFTDLFAINKLPKSGFLEFKPSVVDTTVVAKTKVDKLKNKQKGKVSKYYFAAFYELLKDKNFKSYLYDIAKNTEVIESDDDEDDDEEGDSKQLKEDDKKKNKKESKSHEKILSVILFKPEYNANYKDKSFPLENEIIQNEIASYYEELSKKFNIDLKIIENSGQENFGTKEFNKYALLNDWLIERFNNDTLTMELYQTGFLGDAVADYNTKYLGWTGFLYTAQFKRLENLLLIYELETGKPILIDYVYLNFRPKRHVLRAHIYNQLYSLKNGK